MLKNTVVAADSFSQFEHDRVRLGDRATLYEWLDWMLSPSSNSAAGMVMRQAMLLRKCGRGYPLAKRDIQRLFKEITRSELSAPYTATFNEAITRKGLDIEMLRQVSLFTAGGKARIPGSGDSCDTARELARYLLRMEQGRRVDVFFSTEINRLTYVTGMRIPNASALALADSAVYFKSGSLYQCAPEAGFKCVPYAGNVKNCMNSATIVELPAQDRGLAFISTLVANILRKNAAAEHQALATRLHRAIGEIRRPR